MALQESPDQIEREPEDTAETPNGTFDTQSTASDENDTSEVVESLKDPVEETSSPKLDELDAAKQDQPEPTPASETSISPESLSDVEVEGPAWYVIHCYSGYENKVRHNLEQRIETMGMKDKIFDVALTWEDLDAAPGEYIVGFIIQDLDGKAHEVYTRVTVE